TLRLVVPPGVRGRPVSLETGGHHRLSLDGLLVEGSTRAASSIKSIAADGLEVAIFGGLHPHQPAQRTKAPFEHSLLPSGVSAEEQGVCQLGIVVTQFLFKPRPIRVR